MTDKMRNIVTTALLILLALSAFTAGYFSNDFVEQRFGIGSSTGDSEFGLFWEAWGLIDANYLGDLPTSTQLSYGAIRGALQLLGDPYTVFIEPPERAEEQDLLRGSFGGIGATLSRPEEDGPIILEPIPGNPAEEAGILSGDVLVAVDGTEITPALMVQEVADLIRGEKGTAVILTVIHDGQTEPEDIEIIRGDILIPSVSSRILDDAPDVGYIQLTRFSGESTQEVATAIESLLSEGAENLILDLRGNGGGLLDAAVSITDHFLSDGTVLIQQVKGQDEQFYNASSQTIAEDIPLVVLIDGGTASASEIVAGALQDRERAQLVGSSGSFGKGSVQLVFDLSDGSSIHVTSSRWFTPNRNQIDQMGLTPDVLVEFTQEDLDNFRDVVLIEAVRLLQDE